MARDKTGRNIEPGDVLKVFHYTGARGKRHFMYQQALRYSKGRLLISHLNRVDDSEVRKRPLDTAADVAYIYDMRTRRRAGLSPAGGRDDDNDAQLPDRR